MALHEITRRFIAPLERLKAWAVRMDRAGAAPMLTGPDRWALICLECGRWWRIPGPPVGGRALPCGYWRCWNKCNEQIRSLGTASNTRNEPDAR